MGRPGPSGDVECGAARVAPDLARTRVPAMLRLTAVAAHTPDRAWSGPPPPIAWLEQVNRQALVTRLLAATVHDVNNTLQVVSGAAEVLAMDPTPAAVIRRTEAIVGHARHATTALHALTAFARGAAAPARGTRLKAAVEHAVGLRQHALRKARIAVSVSGDEVECGADEGRVLQILLNVVVNAEQALAGRAGASLAVTLSTDGDTASVSVVDNGPGLDHDQAAAVFHWPPAPSVGGGLGIGLLVSQALAARDGGILAYAPATGGGAVFRLSVPR